MKYKTFSAYWVMDEIKSGKRVYALDRKHRDVAALNDMTVAEAMEVLNLAEIESTRFEFWTEEREEATNDTV